MNNQKYTRDVEMSLVITGRYVDEQVAKGHDLDKVLAECQERPGQAFWFDKRVLRDYSTAVSAAFE